MNILFSEIENSDMPFLRTMLYEAVFWRESSTKPSIEIGLSLPDVSKALDDFGKRDGDFGVVARINTTQVGAAWCRYWTESDNVRGYIEKETPVLVIGVHENHRHKGIGKGMLDWLVDYASNRSIKKLSLCVSKDNHAINLYRQQGFIEYEDIGDSILMIREI